MRKAMIMVTKRSLVDIRSRESIMRLIIQASSDLEDNNTMFEVELLKKVK
jgi:hypothetical protein